MVDPTVRDLLVIAAVVLSVGAGLGMIVMLRRTRRIESAYRAIHAALPDEGTPVPGSLLGAVSALNTRLTAVEGQAATLAATLPHAVQRVGLVRFNPFDDTGSDQSFALALLDAGGDGVVISSLHGRAATRFYAKPVKAGRTTHALTTEEQQALAQAMDEGRGMRGTRDEG
jgi:hypothetical protein